MNKNIKPLVMIDCYVISHALPQLGIWEVFTDSQFASNPNETDIKSLDVLHCDWKMTFLGIKSIAKLNVADNFEKDYPMKTEKHDLYEISTVPISRNTIRVSLKSKYINGTFDCDSIAVEDISFVHPT